MYKPHEQRVIDEKAELDFRLSKMVDFIEGDVYHGLGVAEQTLLFMQASVMSQYSAILGRRIKLFDK